MPDAGLPLYRRVLGPDFDRLPPEIRALHDIDRPARAAGRCEIRRGDNRLALWAGGLLRLPLPGREMPVAVDFLPGDGREIWRRDFAGRGFQTVQEACAGAPGEMIERFGPLAFRLALSASRERLILKLRGVRFLGVPLPRPLWPRIAAGERVEGGAFVFDIAVGLPLIGLLVHYRGWLKRCAETA